MTERRLVQTGGAVSSVEVGDPASPTIRDERPLSFDTPSFDTPPDAQR